MKTNKKDSRLPADENKKAESNSDFEGLVPSDKGKPIEIYEQCGETYSMSAYDRVRNDWKHRKK